MACNPSQSYYLCYWLDSCWCRYSSCSPIINLLIFCPMSKKFLASSLRTDYVSEVNRNTFDTSCRHFASFQFGKIYPIFCTHKQNGETFRCRPAVMLDFETLNHELYNDIKCNIRFYKVNTRSMWPNFRKFSRQDITKDSSIVHPFLSRPDNDWFKVGSLANHLGINPIKYGLSDLNSSTSFLRYNHVGNTVVSSGIPIQSSSRLSSSPDSYEFPYLYNSTYGFNFIGALALPAITDGNMLPVNDNLDFWAYINQVTSIRIPGVVLAQGLHAYISDNFIISLPHFSYYSTNSNSPVHYTSSIDVSIWAGSSLNESKCFRLLNFSYSSSPASGSWTSGLDSSVNSDRAYKWSFAFESKDISFIQSLQRTYPFVTLLFTPHTDSKDSYLFSAILQRGGNTANFYDFPSYTSTSESNFVPNPPFAGLNPVEPLNVLPFRAYRCIYNYAFRDKILDPLRDSSGNIMVDQYCENIGDGADSTTPLVLESARYDDDYFNTCVPSPTMSEDIQRPLVGITVGSDPDSYTLNYQANGEAFSIDVKTHGANGTITDVSTATNSQSVNDLTYLTLKDAIQYGISLQDLQDKRSLELWYEKSYKGNARFTYNDFMKAHFGNEPSLRENLAPEYLGGDTLYVQTHAIVNTSDTSTNITPLGHKGGIASFVGQSDYIECFCDEDCYIMGVVWFSVDNIQCQAMDKLWYLRQPIDYATPEFADLGVAPVLMKEIAPLQTDPAHLNDVFGYQRIYGDKLFSHDTIAGDFCTDKSDYLMIRRFDHAPELSSAFTKINPEELTNVFAFENQLDKIYGRFYFDLTNTTWLSQKPNEHII